MRLANRILVGLALVACESDILFAQATLPRPVVRDSAGIRIIEYPSLGPEAPPSSPRAGNPLESTLRGLPPAFRLESKPYLDIGGIRDNALEELDATHPMLMAVELSDGTIVVNDKVHLKFFTKRGAFIRAVGRRGSGPGEFGQTREVCRLRGDSLLVVDINGRLTVWDAQGKHVQTYARPGLVQGGSCQTDGSVIARALPTPATDGSLAGRMVPYNLMRRDGATVRSLASVFEPLPFTLVQPFPTVLIAGDQVLIADARTWEVRTQGSDGRVRRITRFGKPPVRITDKEWRDRMLGTIPRGSSSANRKSIENMFAHKPDTYPAYAQVRLDPAGRIWVGDYDSRSSYTVLDANGVMLGRFVIPGAGVLSRKQLVGTGADHVVVLDEDGDGAVHLRFHKITPIANPTR